MRRTLEGKCFYRQGVYWTYEFCYRSHVRQFRADPNRFDMKRLSISNFLAMKCTIFLYR